MQKLFNKPQQIYIRKILRQQPVTCERILWNKIRDRRLGGYKFKRQFSVNNYVVDFYCAELKLVIEIDGATHSTDDEIKYDKVRQEYLEKQGLLVKRYLNIDVKENLELVLENILEVCKKRFEQY